MNRLLEQKPKGTPSQAAENNRAKKRKPLIRREIWDARRRQAAIQWGALKEWGRIHFRRAAHIAHGALAVHRMVGPISFLGVSAALGMALTLTTLYSTSYAVTVDGQPVGVVADRGVVDEAIQEVEQEGSTLLGYDYQVKGSVDYQFALTLKTDITQKTEIEDYFFSQLNQASDHLRKCQVLVDGRSVGVIKDEDALNEMLEELKNQYVTENTISAAFVENVSINYVYKADSLMTMEEMLTALEANSTGETTYTVAKGDTFNGIAYANDMSVSDLQALNPGVDINRLMIGDVLDVKELVPTLSVQTLEHQVYTKAIECPVQTTEDSSMYKGTSKITTQGVEGEAQVEANVTYVNGYEQNREILSTTTVREPTATIKAVGTKEKPKTASTGNFSWPIRGKINSYFGGRRIFGSYSFHSGIDIQAAYGATVKAADGGTVTFSGYKGTYGYLVIITHDNGTQTYYGHNSSLLVSAGQKVYKGQAISKAGSTGRSTGTHCHFEIRVNGTAVNPLNYLR
ncbi:MAG: M23 family metallopeptidase [Lawsonibacter sp.]|nr:M23 family metallopeptidase [Lawsonibacter sp.]